MTDARQPQTDTEGALEAFMEHLGVEGRVRHLEQTQARQGEALAHLRESMAGLTRELYELKGDLRGALTATEERLVAAISEIRSGMTPKPIWPAVAALAAVLSTAMAFFAVLYAK
ncbi:MAG: hypothetical protein H6515_14200 [Microthrixaceae bacterium]|nr:hypothetical protein [Microthrixaceae bacterium]